MDINGISNISKLHQVQNTRFAESEKVLAREAENAPIQDEIEISTNARRLSEATEISSASDAGTVRYDLVNRLREEIANGTYDTPERFDVAMERLLSRLG